MKVSKGILDESGKAIVVETIDIAQSQLTDECWFIQFGGLSACMNCKFKDTDECGGKHIRARLEREVK